MKYVIITSKHHDGFAMFHSAHDKFNIVDATPFRRDPMKELAEACRKEGLGFGFYYSHNQDWTTPGASGGPATDEQGNRKTFDDYFRDKCLPQVEEITRNYGDMVLIWFDTPGDYSISAADIPAYRLGFRNFRMDNFGVRSPHLRRLAKRPLFSWPIVSGVTEEDEIVCWNGLQIKSLRTLGERSATGMDSERGVYVRSSEVLGNPLRDYIMVNDAILALNAIPVNNLADLWKALERIDLSQPLRFLIVRNQNQQTVTVPGGVVR